MRKRIFLVGCGPSLNKTPLNLLMEEDSFSLNKIHYIFPQTQWRPTYFYYVDHPTNDAKWRDPIDANAGAKHMWLLREYRDGVPDTHDAHDLLPQHRLIGDRPNVTWVSRCAKHAFYSAGNPRGMKEWHLPDICTAYNGMSGMIQIAVILGYKEIYLVGCDAGYQYDYKKNHFWPDYSEGSEPTNDMEAAFAMQSDNLHVEVAHKIAKAECEKRGVAIYNATLGGALEVYERKNLLHVLES
jgi:hypothetical protein